MHTCNEVPAQRRDFADRRLDDVLRRGADTSVRLSARSAVSPRQYDLDAPQSSTYRVHRLAEADGTRLTIWETPPTRPRAGRFVTFYGNGASVLEFAPVGEEIHRKGFGVVLASYRGYSGNTGRPSEAGLMADARAVLATIPKADRPIILWGHSLGSGVAARMAGEGRGTALILESPYTAVVDVAAAEYPIFPVRWLMKDRFDTFALVPQIKVPVLILHGTEDRIVPFQMGETLAHAFGKQAMFVPISGADHNLNQTQLLLLVMKWLHAHWTGNSWWQIGVARVSRRDTQVRGLPARHIAAVAAGNIMSCFLGTLRNLRMRSHPQGALLRWRTRRRFGGLALCAASGH
jgi:uncharacterized protein